MSERKGHHPPVPQHAGDLGLGHVQSHRCPCSPSLGRLFDATGQQIVWHFPFAADPDQIRRIETDDEPPRMRDLRGTSLPPESPGVSHEPGAPSPGSGPRPATTGTTEEE